MYWRCAKRYICDARCITNANSVEGIRVETAGRHQQEATQTEIEVHTTVASLKRRAEEHQQTTNIYNLRRSS